MKLRIEQLMLEGFAPLVRYRIADAMQRELTRLFAERGLPRSLANAGQVERVQAGAFRVIAGSRAVVVGRQVAPTMYRRLSAGTHAEH